MDPTRNSGLPLIRILRTLLRLALHGNDREGADDRESVLRDARRSQWSHVIDVLEQHMLTPLVAFALKRDELIELMPEPFRAEALSDYRETLFTNTLHRQTLERVLVELNRQGIVPVVFKGAVLASSYYPNVGTRKMGDLDLLIKQPNPHSVGDRVEAALNAAGFRWQLSHGREQKGRHDWAPGITGEGRDEYYANAEGTLLDVHHRVPREDSIELNGLEIPWVRPSGGEGQALVWEPNAMLAHLACHQLKHRHDFGVLLKWLMDLAFVIQRHRTELDFDRIRRLSPTADSLAFLLRSLHFLDSELELKLPASLQEAARNSVPLNLARVLRERRCRPWLKPGRLGWANPPARLIYAQLTGNTADRVLPRIGDLPHWLRDHRREARYDRECAARLRTAHSGGEARELEA